MDNPTSRILNPDCPCKRLKCSRHGDCEACRAHHAEYKDRPTACVRQKEKEARKADRRNRKTK